MNLFVVCFFNVRYKGSSRHVVIVLANTCSKRFFNLSKYSVCSFRLAVCGVKDTLSLYSLENNSPSTIMIDLNLVRQVNVFDIRNIYYSMFIRSPISGSFLNFLLFLCHSSILLSLMAFRYVFSAC